MSLSNFSDDIELVRLDISNLSGNSKSIGPQVNSIRIQEDVTSQYVFAEIDIVDGIGLLHTFPIVGEETFTFEARFPKNNITLKYKFNVFAITNVGLSSRNNAKIYTLKAVSEEAIVNASVLTNKGYKDTYANIISDIVKVNLKSTKKLTKDETRGVHNIVLPNAKPMAAIDMLRKRSISAKNEYAPMLFFETSNGYFLKDIVSLFQEGKSKSRELISYEYNNVEVSSSKQSGVIVSFATPEKYDTFEKINNGAFNNHVTSFDLKTKKLTTYHFDYNQKKSSFETFNEKNTNSSSFIQKYGSEPSRSYLVFVDSTRPDFFVDRLGDKQSYTNIIFQNVSRAELGGVIGKEILQAGGVVYLIFENESFSYDKSTDKKDKGATGYYFIKKLIHEIHLSTGVPMYRASCDLVSGVMMEKIA